MASANSHGLIRTLAGALALTVTLGSGPVYAAPTPADPGTGAPAHTEATPPATAPAPGSAPGSAPAPTTSSATAPMPAADSVPAAAPSSATAPSPGQAEAEAQYARERIHVTTAMLSPRRNNSLSPRRFAPTRGDRGLRGAEFYLAVGRPDLAATYKRRLGIRWGLFAGGATLVVAGLAVGLAGSFRDPKNRTMVIAGAATATGGILLTTSANVFDHFAPAHPIEPAVAKNLIDEHNAALRQRLGLGPLARVRVGAQLSRTSAGLSLGGSF